MKAVSESEMRIMNILWEYDNFHTAKELQLLLAQENDWKITTVQTFLSRLVEKGYVTIIKRNRSNFYGPKVTKDEVASYEANRIVDNLKLPSIGGLIATLIDENTLSDDDIEELRKWLVNKL